MKSIKKHLAISASALCLLSAFSPTSYAGEDYELCYDYKPTTTTQMQTLEGSKKYLLELLRERHTQTRRNLIKQFSINQEYVMLNTWFSLIENQIREWDNLGYYTKLDLDKSNNKSELYKQYGIFYYKFEYLKAEHYKQREQLKIKLQKLQPQELLEREQEQKRLELEQLQRKQLIQISKLQLFDVIADKNTALITEILENHPELVKATNSEGASLLQAAISTKRLDIVECLLDNGVKPTMNDFIFSKAQCQKSPASRDIYEFFQSIYYSYDDNERPSEWKLLCEY